MDRRSQQNHCRRQTWAPSVRFHPLDKFNILVGRNDTGKINILRALNLFFNTETDFRKPFEFSKDFSLNARVGQGKAPEIRIDLTVSIPDGYSAPSNARAIEWTKRWRQNQIIDESPRLILSNNQRLEIGGRSKIHSYLQNIDYHYIPALKGKEFFSELMSDIYDVLSEVSEEELKKASQPLQDQVDEILVNVAEELKVALNAPSTPKLPSSLRSVFRLIQFEANGIDLDRRGDGIRVRHVPSLVKFLCDLKSQRSGRYKSLHLWGLEEPENSVDFISAFDLRDQIIEIAEDSQFQIMMATHSPIFFSLEKMDGVTANFFTQVDSKTVLSQDSDNISDEMGVLRVVYPFIKQSKDELSSIKATLEELRARMEGDMVDPSKRVVFVEGDSDVEVLTEVNRILNTIKDATFVSSFGDSSSCANTVVDNAIAWHFLQRNRPPERRVKAVGLVDCDGAGQAAIQRFLSRMEGEANFHSRVEKIRPTKDLVGLYRKLGFTPLPTLENLFPLSLWLDAKKAGWLSRKSPDQIYEMCSKELRDKVILEGLSVLEEDNAELIPVIYEVIFSRKMDFSKLFVKEILKNSDLAQPFRVTLATLRGVLNKELT